MARYRRKVTEVEAVQFTDPANPPPGVFERHGEPLLFFVTTIHGDPTPIRLGDWVMPEPDGEHFYPCESQVFDATYEPVEVGEFHDFVPVRYDVDVARRLADFASVVAAEAAIRVCNESVSNQVEAAARAALRFWLGWGMVAPTPRALAVLADHVGQVPLDQPPEL